MTSREQDPPPPGDQFQRHKPSQRNWEFPASDPEAIDHIEAHISRHVGTADTVLHEIISERVHIDIQIVPPTPERDFYTLVTTGMSDRPMAAPEGLEEYRYAELVLCLPPNWPVPDLYEREVTEERYWPIRWLKILARFPHEYDTWLWASHTVPNGDPPQPYAANTRLCCAMIAHPMLFDEGFITLKIRDGKTVHFHSFIPIYPEEMQYKLSHGFEALNDRLYRHGVTELLDLKRKNVAQSSPFGSIH